MTQEDLNEWLGKSLANYQLRQLAEDGGNLDSALTLIDRLESELLNAQEHAQNLEFLLKQKNDMIPQLEAKAEAYDRLMSMNSVSKNEIKIVLDGNAWCAYRLPFRNLQEDDAGFGATPQIALTALLESELPDGWEEQCLKEQCKR